MNKYKPGQELTTLRQAIEAQKGPRGRRWGVC